MQAASFLRSGRRPLALGALAGAFAAALLGFSADPAQAACSAQVEAGTLTITGDAASDQLVLRLQAGSPSTLEVDVGGDGTADFSFDRNTFTAIDVHAGAGADTVRIDQSGCAFTDEAVTMDGGAGNDTLLGGAGGETLAGGKGDDVVDGGQGADLGAGDDRLHWDPGDGSDVVEGGAGSDLLDFFGSAAGERIDVATNGKRVRLTRDIGAVVLDLAGVERLGYHALGGADTILINELSGTDVQAADVDLGLLDGSGDAQPDTVIANGTSRRDTVQVTRTGDQVLTTGLVPQLRIAGSEGVDDTLRIQTLDGDDDVTVAPDVAELIRPVVDLGNDG
jgi:RTX calcium-binding nonapeptide repeat (4 copies)